jgi:hypothetical protein
VGEFSARYGFQQLPVVLKCLCALNFVTDFPKAAINGLVVGVRRIQQPHFGQSTGWSGLNQNQLNVIRITASQYLVATISDEQQPVTTANGSEYRVGHTFIDVFGSVGQ